MDMLVNIRSNIRSLSFFQFQIWEKHQMAMLMNIRSNIRSLSFFNSRFGKNIRWLCWWTMMNIFYPDPMRFFFFYSIHKSHTWWDPWDHRTRGLQGDPSSISIMGGTCSMVFPTSGYTVAWEMLGKFYTMLVGNPNSAKIISNLWDSLGLR